MRILDRYISNSIIGIFISTIFIFAFLYILVDVFGNLEDFIEKKVRIETILKYYTSFLPIIIVNTSPIACLIATLFTYSSLNTHNEIIAIRACGMNFWQVARPALCLGIVVTALVLFINERFVPQSSLISEEIRESKIKITVGEKATGQKPLIKNLTFYGQGNRLFFIDVFDPNTNEISGATIIGQDENQNLREKITAFKGKWTGIAWKFYNCQITTFISTLPNVPGEIKIYPEKLMDIKETPMDFLRQRLDITAMNIRQLKSYIKRFSGSGDIKTINNFKVDLHQKIAFPFRNIIIVLMGLPFALMVGGKRKAMTFTSIGLALGIGFLYYVIDAVGLALGKGGALSPPLAAWLAPGSFLLVALTTIFSKFK